MRAGAGGAVDAVHNPRNGPPLWLLAGLGMSKARRARRPHDMRCRLHSANDSLRSSAARLGDDE